MYCWRKDTAREGGEKPESFMRRSGGDGRCEHLVQALARAPSPFSAQQLLVPSTDSPGVATTKSTALLFHAQKASNQSPFYARA